MTIYPALTIGKVSGIEFCHRCKSQIFGIRFLLQYPGCSVTRVFCMGLECRPEGADLAIAKWERKNKKKKV